MRDSELAEITRRITQAEHHQVETCVAYNYAAGPGEYQVRLNPDAEALPAPVRLYLTAAQARKLAVDLLAQANDADRRNGTGPDIGQLADRVHGFLADQLERDDMSLAEISGEIITMVIEES